MIKLEREKNPNPWEGWGFQTSEMQIRENFSSFQNNYNPFAV